MRDRQDLGRSETAVSGWCRARTAGRCVRSLFFRALTVVLLARDAAALDVLLVLDAGAFLLRDHALAC